MASPKRKQLVIDVKNLYRHCKLNPGPWNIVPDLSDLKHAKTLTFLQVFAKDNNAIYKSIGICGPMTNVVKKAVQVLVVIVDRSGDL